MRGVAAIASVLGFLVPGCALDWTGPLPPLDAGADTVEDVAGEDTTVPDTAGDDGGDGCTRGNNVAILGVASSSGGGTGVWGANHLNNGRPESDCDLHWVTAGSTPGDAWLQIEWVDDQVLWGMEIDTNQWENTTCWDLGGATLAGGTIQIRDGLDWVDHGTVSGQSDDWSYVFDPPVTTSGVRIHGAHATDLGGQTENPLIYEWEIYECG